MFRQSTAIGEEVYSAIESIPELREYGGEVKQQVHQAVLDGGEETRRVVDFLHGTWLGHPLHPMLTDITIGAWVLGSLFDVFSVFGGGKSAARAADKLHGLGTVSGLATGATGFADYSTAPNPAVPVAAVHGLTNGAALILQMLSSRARRRGARGLGVLLSTAGLGLATFSGWLGGELVFRHRVGVNHSKPVKGPRGWTTVMADAELAEGQPRRVELDGYPVLLYREGGTVYAIGAVCSHAGAPLEEGTFYDTCVQCPWHDSVFDLRDGSVVHGPSTYALPGFEVRVYEGQIQARLAEPRR